METNWICRKCDSATETYNDERGIWFSCSNEDCNNYNKMRREEDIDFLEYFKEA